MKTLFNLILYVFAFVLTSCNNEVFVENFTPEFEYVKLKGNGETTTIKINCKSLENIWFDAVNDYGYYRPDYYDKYGEIIHSENFTDIHRINYVTPFITFVLWKNENSIILEALDNSSEETFRVIIFLEYGEVVETISVDIEPGDPLKLTYIGYDFNQKKTGNAIESTLPTRYVNESDSTVKIVFYPFNDLSGSVILSDFESWGYGLTGEMELPIFLNDEWSEHMTEKVNGSFGPEFGIHLDNENLKDNVKIEIPPHSTVTVNNSICYATFEAPFIAIFEKPVSHLEQWLDGTISIRLPVSYALRIEQQNL